MNRPDGILTRGSLILTHATLGDTDGMLVDSKNLAQRRASAEGRLGGPVAGHLGGVYWVNHGDISGHRAAYRVEEFELFAPPPPAVNRVPDKARPGSTVSATFRKLLEFVV